jgi:hypothetical protein
MEQLENENQEKVSTELPLDKKEESNEKEPKEESSSGFSTNNDVQGQSEKDKSPLEEKVLVIEKGIYNLRKENIIEFNRNNNILRK